jgi:hypothetical protein
MTIITIHYLLILLLLALVLIHSTTAAASTVDDTSSSSSTASNGDNATPAAAAAAIVATPKSVAINWLRLVGKRDFVAATKLFAPDGELIYRTDIAYGGTWRGPNGVHKFFEIVCVTSKLINYMTTAIA